MYVCMRRRIHIYVYACMSALYESLCVCMYVRILCAGA